ncbi:hypothetical protein SEUCBS140593_006868 [Sporothrix eucalyptigena]|uniref:Uncharacterized protein n=1 Tax=Sporothrix eucalyptigena TaxID=1812306 RepID=A0ABP0C918_9PEZI
MSPRPTATSRVTKTTKTTKDKFGFVYNHGVEDGGDSNLLSLSTELIRVEGDSLIPTSAVIDRGFRDARATWLHFPVHFAARCACIARPAAVGSSPGWAADLAPGPEYEQTSAKTVAGHGEELVLWYKGTILCRSSAELSSDADAVSLRGHLILTLGWAYILSVHLLEIQRRPVVYSQDALQLQRASEAAHLRRHGWLVLSLTVYGVLLLLVRWL